MAGGDGRHDTSLIGRLHRQPYRFDMRQAVRLLEQTAPMNTVPVGIGSDPRREAVRLRSSLSSNFPPSEIESLETLNGGPQPTMTVTEIGLAGAYGPLPPPLTERVLERERVKDHSARDFLDLFNHRLLSLRMRLERLFNPALQIDSRQEVASAETAASVPILAALGLATLTPPEVEERVGGIAISLMGAAGLLNPRPFSAHALERMVGAHFGLPVRVTQMRGGWIVMDAEQHTKLGRSGSLGRGAVLGKRIWDQTIGILIEIGPTDRDTLLKFLPDGSKYAELAELVAFALGETFDVELRVILDPKEVPPAALSDPRQQLGRTAWLGQAPRATPGVLRLRLERGRAAG